jgi:hypothetical protein
VIALLPSEGVCQACYLLGYAARLDQPPTFEEWLRRAGRVPAGQAFCQDLRGVAESLVAVGIANVDDGDIQLISDFPKCSTADRVTKLKIAKLLLQRQRPTWLPLSGDVHRIYPALVPRDDLVALQWLGDDLVHILAAILIAADATNTAQKLGQLGELIIAASERSRGHSVVHVSEISASYGYDLESSSRDGSLARIEVKCTVEGEAGKFHLSRHEFERSLEHRSEWILVQIVLAGQLLWTQDVLDSRVIVCAKTIPNDVVASEMVSDRAFCIWEESVKFGLPIDRWGEYPLYLPPEWQMPNPLRVPNRTAYR